MALTTMRFSLCPRRGSQSGPRKARRKQERRGKEKLQKKARSNHWTSNRLKQLIRLKKFPTPRSTLDRLIVLHCLDGQIGDFSLPNNCSIIASKLKNRGHLNVWRHLRSLRGQTSHSLLYFWIERLLSHSSERARISRQLLGS